MDRVVVGRNDARVVVNGKDLSGRGVQCWECGRAEMYSRTVANSKGVEASVLARKFNQRGWHRDSKGWHCPECIAAAKAKKSRPEPRALTDPLPPAKVITIINSEPKENHMPVDAPPSTREEVIARMLPGDRRRIFREIDDNWNEAAGRYLGAVTDRTIAEKLKLPPVWVETVRRESFGESADNDEIEKLQGELSKLEGTIQLQIDAALKAATALETSLKTVRDLSTRLQTVEKSVGLKR